MTGTFGASLHFAIHLLALTIALGVGLGLLARMARDAGFKARATRLKWRDLTGLGTAYPVLARLSDANREVAGAYPGDRLDRQPVHTVYGGAQLFSGDLVARLGGAARRALEEKAAATALVRLDQISDELKKLILGQAELRLADRRAAKAATKIAGKKR